MSEAARFSGTPPASETFKPADVARYGELGFVELAGHTLTVRRSASPVEIDLRRASLSGTARDARVWTPKGELRLVPADWVDGERLLSLVLERTPRSRVSLVAEPPGGAGALRPSANRARGSSVLSGATGRFTAVSEFDPARAGIRMAGGTSGATMSDSVYQALLNNRIIFLGDEVRDDNANAICAQMLLLNAEDPHKDIYLYINSPGGSVTAGMAIFDTMQWISNDVATVAMGLAASMGQFLLSAGTPGKRYALPHAKIMMHQPSGGIGGSASDIKILAEQMLHTKKEMAELIAKHTGKSVEQITADSDRDRWFTASEALEYGFIDHVYERAADIQSADAPNK